jgi:hypothetical protein
MGLKKYEIITVGSDKRVRALRSWQVGDRYVNIGDVGGIVYDEKTLSQDGACWLFRGNFGFPGARIGGDSIVDVAETALSTTGAPAVDILGSSVVVGGRLRFVVDQTAADAVVLTAADFEQGTFNYAAGANWETWKLSSPSYLRTKSPIFMGGTGVTLKVDVPGYTVQAYVLDRDGIGIAATALTDTGVGVTLSIPAGQYFVLTLAKNPVGPTVPADATAAQITFTGSYEVKLSIIDSRVVTSPATGAGVIGIRPGGTYTMASGAKYPEIIIRNSNVSIYILAIGRRVRLMGQIIGSTVTIDAASTDLTLAGQYNNVKNLTASGAVTTNTGVESYNIIQATDCDNFAVSPTIFPGLAAAQTANMPFIFQGCNVPNGIFYHHAQIANTYKNIDFALAQSDLGKLTANGYTLCSAEVEGAYRCVSTALGIIGALVEAHDSVKSLNMTGAANTYGTTIYKDAYFNGIFEFAGTNVFGNKVRSHPLAQVLNVQPRAVQGALSTSVVGQTITGIIPLSTHVSVPTPLRLNGATGLRVDNIPAGIEATFVYVNPSNTVTANSAWTASSLTVASAQLKEYKAYLMFRKADNVSPITPADLAGVTVTVYNGCKLVNTGATAVNIKGNIRVEDNATLTDCSLIGSGYFGGNAVMLGMAVDGCAYMRDNASIIKTAGSVPIRNLKMTENAYAVIGDFQVNGTIYLSDNARFTPTSAGVFGGGLIMKDNAVITGRLSVSGVLTMKDNAKVVLGTATTKGDITLCGSYNQTVSKAWTGKRVIDNENAPEYDNNVKTQYDF